MRLHLCTSIRIVTHAGFCLAFSVSCVSKVPCIQPLSLPTASLLLKPEFPLCGVSLQGILHTCCKTRPMGKWWRSLTQIISIETGQRRMSALRDCCDKESTNHISILMFTGSRLYDLLGRIRLCCEYLTIDIKTDARLDFLHTYSSTPIIIHEPLLYHSLHSTAWQIAASSI